MRSLITVLIVSTLMSESINELPYEILEEILLQSFAIGKRSQSIVCKLWKRIWRSKTFHGKLVLGPVKQYNVEVT